MSPLQTIQNCEEFLYLSISIARQHMEKHYKNVMEFSSIQSLFVSKSHNSSGTGFMMQTTGMNHCVTWHYSALTCEAN